MLFGRKTGFSSVFITMTASTGGETVGGSVRERFEVIFKLVSLIAVGPKDGEMKGEVDGNTEGFPVGAEVAFVSL